MRHPPGWKAFEDHVVNKLGLSATVASGSQDYDKGDGTDRRHPTLSNYLLQVDAKYTETGSLSINAKKMDQWVKQAALAGHHFALPIRMWPKSQVQPSDYVAIPLDDYAQLLDFRRTREEWNA